MKEIQTINNHFTIPSYKGLQKYEIEDCLLEGSNGNIYLGKYGEKAIVLKIFFIDKSQPPENVARFRREARLLANVKHPNIIEVIEIGHDEKAEVDFIVMPYVEGEPLDKTLNKEVSLGYRESSWIISEIAEGIQAVHSQNLVYRDLKPSNVIYHKKKRYIKIIDFGIAREMYWGQQITREGEVLGTPLYMSPEQAMGQAVDFRSDIYNLGAMFFHLLTGRPPFIKGTATATLMAHIEEIPIWPGALINYIPQTIQDITNKMLQKSPAKRYQSMQEIKSAVDNYKQ